MVKVKSTLRELIQKAVAEMEVKLERKREQLAMIDRTLVAPDEFITAAMHDEDSLWARVEKMAGDRDSIPLDELAYEFMQDGYSHPKEWRIPGWEFSELNQRLVKLHPVLMKAREVEKPNVGLPVEVHHTKEFDADAAMEAVRALCKGA